MNNRYMEYLQKLRTDYTPCFRLEFLHPDGSVALEITEDLLQSGGTLNVTNQNGCRRTASIALDNWANLYDTHVDKLFLGQQVRLLAGLYLDDGTPFCLPQGVFYISNPSEVFQPAARTVSLSLADKWAYLDGSLFGRLPGVYILSAGDDLFTAIRTLLLTDRGNGLPLDPVPPLLSADYVGKTIVIDGVEQPVLACPYTARSSDTYGGVLSEIATMLVATIGYDACGQLRVESANVDAVPEALRQVLWAYTTEERELLAITFAPEPAKTYNHILITGGTLGGRVASGEAVNDDPASPTSVQRIGKKTLWESQPKYYADSQCAALAAHYLEKYRSLGATATITSAPMYHLQENALVTVFREGVDDAPVPCRINGWTLPIGQMGQMTITATRTERLARDFRAAAE